MFGSQARIESILIVEPQARIRAAMELTLQQGGYRVLADDGANVFKLIEDEVPDVVLLACQCEDAHGDGFAICKQIVADGIAAAVIMTSAQATKEMVIQAVRAGAKNFAVTPASGSEFYERLERAYSQTPQAESRSKFPIIRFGPRQLSRPQKVDVIMRDVATIRVMPHSVAKILQFTTQSESCANDVAKAAGSDPTVASMLLKRANSSYYGGAEAVADIQSAIVRIGFRECRDQVIGMTTANLFPRGEKSFGFNRIWYWIHSLACGLLGEHIARRSSFENKDHVFVSGLMHDLGKIILDDFLIGPYGQVIRRAHTQNSTVRAAELALLERDHAQVGSAVARNWRFPDAVCEAIAKHHDQERLTEAESPSLTGAIYLANHMAKALLIGSSGDFIIPSISTNMWAAYRCDDISPPALIDMLYEQLREFCSFLQISEEQTDVALDHDCDSGVAVLYDPHDRNRFLLSLFLTNQGFDVQVLPETDTFSNLDTPPTLALVWPADPGEAVTVCNMIESHAQGPWPTICILEQPEAEAQLRADRPWLRTCSSPLDCFTLLVLARQLVPDILKAKIIAHGNLQDEVVAAQ